MRFAQTLFSQGFFLSYLRTYMISPPSQRLQSCLQTATDGIFLKSIMTRTLDVCVKPPSSAQ
jgi:hypothetical protein